MKKIFLLMAVSAGLIACQSAPEGDRAATADQQQVASSTGSQYAVDTTTSNVLWTGTKPVGQHTGTFKLNEGILLLNNGQLTGGSFTINVASLNNTDLTGEYKTKLEGHLKSGDFFATDKFPTARFEITNVQPFDSTNGKSLLQGATHLISGNLTLKDSTKNVTFPAVVNVAENDVTAKANFNIDRTQWGMAYGNDKSLQDNFIRPEVNIQLDIKARKQ